MILLTHIWRQILALYGYTQFKKNQYFYSFWSKKVSKYKATNFKPNRISNFYHLNWCISVLRVAGWYFIFIKILIEHSVSKQGLPDQTPQYTLPMSHKKGCDVYVDKVALS